MEPERSHAGRFQSFPGFRRAFVLEDTMSSVNDHAGRTNKARLGKIAILLTVALRIAGAQTQLDLGRKGKDVDFATAQSTRPAQPGTALPPSCSVGQLFYKANAAAGNNLFGCTA